MKLKYTITNILCAGVLLFSGTSCQGFLDKAPYDALSETSTWKTEDDAKKFAIGCYDGWESGEVLLYADCMSDFGYNNFPWEGFRDQANGTMSPSNTGYSFYHFTTIRRCNEFLTKVQDIKFADEAEKQNLIGQIKTIRAYRYFVLNFLYGGVPIIDSYMSAEEAKVPRKAEAEVRTAIAKDLDEAIAALKDRPSERGRIAKGAALAIKMREALYYDDWETAKKSAQAIIDLGVYELDPSYETLFNVSGKDSKEIILATQYLSVTKPLGTIGQMYNNAEGGWSSIVPTYNLVNTYEMRNGKTINEAGSGYDPTHPFMGRDPRMAMTILYPGADYKDNNGVNKVFNTLDKEISGGVNKNFPVAADNASKTGLTWKKYVYPMDQYSDIWSTDVCPIVFRYAEVLLSWAEAENELNGPSKEVYNKLNAVRTRVGMPTVDEGKYSTKDALRELIHRERAVELAGEGIRRGDILRWKTTDGKMLAEVVLSQTLERLVGTVDMNGANPETRATIKLDAAADEKKIEDRVFKPYNRYFPIPQSDLDNNDKLVQNPGYAAPKK